MGICLYGSIIPFYPLLVKVFRVKKKSSVRKVRDGGSVSPEQYRFFRHQNKKETFFPEDLFGFFNSSSETLNNVYNADYNHEQYGEANGCSLENDFLGLSPVLIIVTSEISGNGRGTCRSVALKGDYDDECRSTAEKDYRQYQSDCIHGEPPLK